MEKLNKKIEDEKTFQEVEQFDRDGYLKLESNQLLSKEDELLLQSFSLSGAQFGQQLSSQIEKKLE